MSSVESVDPESITSVSIPAVDALARHRLQQVAQVALTVVGEDHHRGEEPPGRRRHPWPGSSPPTYAGHRSPRSVVARVVNSDSNRSTPRTTWSTKVAGLGRCSTGTSRPTTCWIALTTSEIVVPTPLPRLYRSCCDPGGDDLGDHLGQVGHVQVVADHRAVTEDRQGLPFWPTCAGRSGSRPDASGGSAGDRRGWRSGRSSTPARASA